MSKKLNKNIKKAKLRLVKEVNRKMVEFDAKGSDLFYMAQTLASLRDPK